jgi:hypothetical protein
MREKRNQNSRDAMQKSAEKYEVIRMQETRVKEVLVGVGADVSR